MENLNTNFHENPRQKNCLSQKTLKGFAISSYLTNQKIHREFKDSFELVRIRARMFTEGISPTNVVFFCESVFTDGMHVGHFNQSGVQVRV